MKKLKDFTIDEFDSSKPNVAKHLGVTLRTIYNHWDTALVVDNELFVCRRLNQIEMGRKQNG